MFCSKCGTQLNEGSVFCSRCGAQVALVTGPLDEEVSPKSRVAVTLLSCPMLYVGLFGAHRFYMGKIKSAVIMLLMGLAPFVCGVGIMVTVFTSSAFEEGDSPPPLFFVLYGLAIVLYLAVFVWSLIDFIFAVTGNFKDSQGKPIKKW
jgi:hypothetical protein